MTMTEGVKLTQTAPFSGDSGVDREIAGGADTREGRSWGPRIIFKSFGSLTGGKILGDVATLALFILISRLFGQEGIGKYSVAMALTGIIAIFSELGTTTFTIHELSHSPEPFSRLFGRILSLRLVLIVAASLLLALLWPFLPFSNEALWIIAVVGAYQLMYQLVVGFGAVFIAVEKPAVAGLFDGGYRGLAALGAIAVALLGGGLLLTLSIMPAISLVTVPAAYVFLRARVGRPQLVASARQIVRTGREILPYGLSGILASVQQRLDVTLLGLLIGSVAAGIYNVAYRPVFMFWFIPYFLAISVLPVASRLHAESSPKLPELFRRSLNLSVLVGLPVSAGLALVAEDAILLVFGEEFLESVPLLQLLAWLLVFAFLRYNIGAFLTATGRQVQRTRAQAWSFALALLLYAVLIPAYGPMGAGVAALLAEISVVVLFALNLRTVFGWPRLGSRLLIGGAATATFVLVFTVFADVPLTGVIAGSAALYAGTLLLFPQIRREELKLGLALLRGRRSEARGPEQVSL